MKARLLLLTCGLLQLAALAAQPDAPSNDVQHCDTHTCSPAHSSAVVRVVHGILSYSTWPDATDPRAEKSTAQGHGTAVRVLCLVGSSPHREALQASATAVQGAPLKVRASSVERLQAGDDCQAVYLGALAADELATVLRLTVGKPIVTILEHSEYCDEGALVCLQTEPQGRLSFQINLDAVSLSQVRISPQVLKMSRPVEAPDTAP